MSADADYYASARARGAEDADGDSDGGVVIVEVVAGDAGAGDEGKSAAAVRGGGGAVQKNKAHRDGHVLNHATLWVVQLIFAVMHVFSNRALAHLTPTVFCAFRLAIGMPFLAVNARRERRDAPAMTRGMLVWVFPMACAIGCAYLMVFVCNKRSGASLVAFVQPVMPVSTAVFSAVLGLEPFTRLKAYGVFTVFVGTVVALRAYEIFENHGTSAVDVLLLLTQTNSYAAYVVMLSRATKDHPYPLTFLFLATFLAEIAIFAIAIPSLIKLDITAVPASAWGAVIFAGVGSSAVAHSLNSWAIARVKSVLPTVYSGLQVIFTIILAAIFLNETVGWDQGLGIFVTMIGVSFVARAKYDESHDARASSHAVNAVNAAADDDDDETATSHAPSHRDPALRAITP